MNNRGKSENLWKLNLTSTFESNTYFESVLIFKQIPENLHHLWNSKLDLKIPQSSWLCVFKVGVNKSSKYFINNAKCTKTPSTGLYHFILKIALKAYYKKESRNIPKSTSSFIKFTGSGGWRVDCEISTSCILLREGGVE